MLLVLRIFTQLEEDSHKQMSVCKCVMEQSQIQRCVASCQSRVHIFAHRYVNVGEGGGDDDDDAEECGNLA